MAELARCLGVTRQAAHKLSLRQLDPPLELAVRARAALLVRCQSAPYPTWLLPKEKTKHRA